MTSALTPLLHTRSVLFFSGKGGVGKTTLASAAALAAAKRGRDVQLYSTDPAHNLGHLWHRDLAGGQTQLWPAGNQEAPRGTGRITGAELNAEQLAAAHISEVGATMRRAIAPELAAHLDQYLELVKHAPGTSEAALGETIAQLCCNAEPGGPLLIFDTAPTGHTARLMHLPETMAAYTTALLRRRQRADRLAEAANALGGRTEGANTDLAAALARRKALYSEFRSLLQDGAHTNFVLVLAAERMPVAETINFAHELADLGIRVGAAITNRRSPAQFAARAEMEARYEAELRAALPAIPVINIALLDGEPTGVQALEQLANTL